MLRFRSTSTLNALRFLALFCAAAFVLRAQAPPAAPKLAVEIRVAPEDEPSIGIVEQGFYTETVISTPTFVPLPGHKSTDNSLTQSRNLDLCFHLDGDAVDIEAKLAFPRTTEGSALMTEGRGPNIELGSYQGRLGDTISLEKFSELGFQPPTIKIVSAERQSTSLPIVTHVPSITARVASQDTSAYKISLHNLSAQGVTAFMGRDALKNGNTEISESSGKEPVIAARGKDEFPLYCRESRDIGTNDADREPCAFVLEAALFADGSYEGDVDSAATLDMRMLTRHSQVLRIRQALQVILDDKTVPESSRIARMRAKVSNLGYEPDPTIKERLHLKYPGVSESVLEQVDPYMHGLFDSMQTATLLDLQGIESSPQPSISAAYLLASPELN